MIAFVALWLGAAASFALGWVVRGWFADPDRSAHEYLEGYEDGVAAERAASRKRGQELAEAIDVRQQAKGWVSIPSPPQSRAPAVSEDPA